MTPLKPYIKSFIGNFSVFLLLCDINIVPVKILPFYNKKNIIWNSFFKLKRMEAKMYFEDVLWIKEKLKKNEIEECTWKDQKLSK